MAILESFCQSLVNYFLSGDFNLQYFFMHYTSSHLLCLNINCFYVGHDSNTPYFMLYTLLLSHQMLRLDLSWETLELIAQSNECVCYCLYSTPSS